ncbi:MAG: tetratricopeptide repeat protein [Sphingomonadales bacterium]|nr:tetratricopeptide repeat protein [Sphingomonadales bacterium]
MTITKAIAATVIGVFVGLGAAGSAGAYTMELQMQRSDVLHRARTALEDGKLDRAVRLYQKGLEKGLNSRDVPVAHNNICVAFILLKKYEKAIEHCDTAVSMDPSNWRYHNNLGNAYLELGEYELAIGHYQRGLKISPRAEILSENLDIAEERIQRSSLLRGQPISRDESRLGPDGEWLAAGLGQ